LTTKQWCRQGFTMSSPRTTRPVLRYILVHSETNEKRSDISKLQQEYWCHLANTNNSSQLVLKVPKS